MKISKARWAEAQEFEYNDWNNEPDIVNKEWAEASKKYESYLKKLAERLNLNNKSKVLDVGCSATCVSRMLGTGELYGIEPLADKLKLDEQIKEVKIFQGMAEDMEMFKESEFDFIICRNVIDHTHAPEEVIKEMFRVIKPDGHVLLACYVYNPFITLVKNFGEIIKILRNVGHPHTYTMKSFEKLSEKRFEILERKIVYEGKDPNDFGKIDEVKGNLPPVQKAVMFVNDQVLGHTWFVREYALLLKPLQN